MIDGCDQYQNISLQRLFEQRVLLSKDNNAVVFNNQAISFSQLEEKANKLANLLISSQIKPQNRVAILLDRSIDTIVSMLAILKVGATYIPIDLNYPSSRIEYMLEDSQCHAALVDESGLECMNAISVQSDFCVVRASECEAISSGFDAYTSQPSDLAYIIYTSGSTGKPKGVCVTHQNLLNFNAGMQESIGLDSVASIASLTTVCFDIFVLESIVALLQGLSIHLVSDDQRKSATALAQVTESVDALQITPSHLTLLMEDPRFTAALSKLNLLLIGGEALPQPLLEKLQSATSARLFNMYGPTETTVWSCVQELTHRSQVDIGLPILNTQVYLLNEEAQPVEEGEVGELCITGMGVSAGYWKKPELTAQSFVQHPLVPNGKLYKTGDLGVRQLDGSYQCLGRKDHQVKVNGHRIELGDIESHILAVSGVQQVGVVLSQTESVKVSITAFVVLHSDESLNPGQIREALVSKLPDYMIPSHIQVLTTLPLTDNGKVDRKSLVQYPIQSIEPVDVPGASMPEAEISVPETDIEEEVHRLWCEVFNRSPICCEQGFMAMGGTSVLAIQLLGAVHSELGIEVKFSDFITRANTIRDLSVWIEDLILADMSDEEIEALMASE
ncbi:non-ribosomal peptide synthetase [Vibrio nigripulchritudo]|uniref:non-ribosomal peptide synthetase n=1 Tax=Vibrio nigripulchritudo TaxID=28173 RepID=UPI000696328F|nr:non-ribosomal peptide synthetase [Vibrio nigripulchritudo]